MDGETRICVSPVMKEDLNLFSCQTMNEGNGPKCASSNGIRVDQTLETQFYSSILKRGNCCAALGVKKERRKERSNRQSKQEQTKKQNKKQM